MNVPVRYILESEPWKTEFLSSAEVSELAFLTEFPAATFAAEEGTLPR